MLLHSRLDWVHNSGVSASLLQRGTFIPGTTYFGGPDVRDLVPQSQTHPTYSSADRFQCVALKLVGSGLWT